LNYSVGGAAAKCSYPNHRHELTSNLEVCNRGYEDDGCEDRYPWGVRGLRVLGYRLSVGDEGDDVAIEILDMKIGPAPGLFSEGLCELYVSRFKFLE
jgi:hypothetical protein